MKKWKTVLMGTLLVLSLCTLTACGDDNGNNNADESGSTTENAADRNDTDKTDGTMDGTAADDKTDTDKNNETADENAAGQNDTASDADNAAEDNNAADNNNGTDNNDDTVSGELGDSVRDLCDGVGDAVEDVGDAVGNAAEGR